MEPFIGHLKERLNTQSQISLLFSWKISQASHYKTFYFRMKYHSFRVNALQTHFDIENVTMKESRAEKVSNTEKFKGIPRVGGAWNVISLLFPAKGNEAIKSTKREGRSPPRVKGVRIDPIWPLFHVARPLSIPCATIISIWKQSRFFLCPVKRRLLALLTPGTHPLMTDLAYLIDDTAREIDTICAAPFAVRIFIGMRVWNCEIELPHPLIRDNIW